jgi:CRISPR-associated protein Csy1
MTTSDPQRVAELRAVIADFLKKRLDDKLEKIKDSDEKAIAARQKELDRFDQATWLGHAAKRVKGIQLVTHVLKATHPAPKIYEATNLYVAPAGLAPIDLVGSHVLGDDYADDVTGDAAVLDVYGFLTQCYQGRTLLELMRDRDAALAEALDPDPVQAADWISTFAKIDEPRRSNPASHTMAKQLYWPVGDDPHDDTGFHLLAPLYASSLAHRVYLTIQDDRFSEEAKAARKARQGGEFSERPVREYREHAVQQLGGTKPQNISQLNSERRGNNYLLASLPPIWKSVDLKPLYGTDTLFRRYGQRDEVRQTLKGLLAFLKTDPARNVETRAHRAGMVDALIDELLQFTAELRTLAPGWSGTPECQLNLAERHWLDPEGVAGARAAAGQPLPTDTAEQISAAFANWLNARLRDPLPMGDPEFLEWRKRMHEQIKADERGDRDDD